MTLAVLVLRQRSLKRVRGHHHHRQRTQRAQLVRRQKLSLHDVIQIARNITVSPPVKTLHLFSGSSTTTTTVATNPTILPHPVVYSDRKDTVIKDTDPKKEEKLSTPLQSPPVSNAESAPPASSQGAHERDTKDSVLQEIEFAIDKLVDAQTESFEGSLNLIVNNLIQSDEIESYQDLLFESIAVSKLEIPESSDDDSTLDFDTDDQVDTLYSFRTSHPPLLTTSRSSKVLEQSLVFRSCPQSSTPSSHPSSSAFAPTCVTSSFGSAHATPLPILMVKTPAATTHGPKKSPRTISTT